MKKSSFGLGLGLSMLLAVVLNFVSMDAAAQSFEPPVLGGDGGKIPCHSSSSAAAGQTYTMCSTCTSSNGQGSDAGQCRPN